MPRHVAFIMDGNGRWAKKKGLKERIEGHEKGAQVLCELVTKSLELGIKYLTFYVFSTENWARTEKEVKFILSDLLPRYLVKNAEFMTIPKRVRLRTIGDLTKLPQNARGPLEYFIEETKNNTDIDVILALNYGSKQEILNAVKGFARDALQNPEVIDNLDETKFKSYLYNPDVPDPDMLIRTGGEQRLSNFLLWQLSYTELWNTDTYWPEFTVEEFEKAISDYKKRERRYGCVSV